MNLKIVREAAQLTLDFDHRPALGGEDFLIAPPNADAVRWLDTSPDFGDGILPVLVGITVDAETQPETLRLRAMIMMAAAGAPIA